MAAPKKPLVNWFSRTKEKSSSTTDSTENRVKKVVAPESKLSRGFSKTDSLAVSIRKPNDSTQTTSVYSSLSKSKTPNSKGGGGNTTYTNARTTSYSGKNNTTSDTTSVSKNRNPSVGRSGVSENFKSTYNSVSKNNAIPKDTSTYSASKKVMPKLKKK